jgi:hypothetical protein
MTASVSMLECTDATIVEFYLGCDANGRTSDGTIHPLGSPQLLAKIRRAGSWSALRLAEQADAVAKARSFTSWPMVTGRISVDAELLSRTD